MSCLVTLALLWFSIFPLANSRCTFKGQGFEWAKFKGFGVNLGGWLVQEEFVDTDWWALNGLNSTDEWGLCAAQGSRCGPILEQRYASFITTEDIDRLASVGVTVLRIPTSYAAWVRVPGSQLYSGRQIEYFRNISYYAISQHHMHVILDVHSLPGGVNGQGHGEKTNNFGWFSNETALKYSYMAIDSALDYIQQSKYPESYSLAPINEPVDNEDLTKFGTPASLSDTGAAWVLNYILGVLEKIAIRNAKIPLMFQVGFRPVSFWAPQLPTSANIVFDVHNYYFVGKDTTSDNIASYMAVDAAASVDPEGRFPSFVGEWSIQAQANNTLDNRVSNLKSGLASFRNWTQGSTYWTAKFSGKDSVSGEGEQADYWSFENFIDLGAFADTTI